MRITDYYVNITHRGRTTLSITGSSAYEEFISEAKVNASFKTIIGSAMANRPDLVSFALSDTPDLWWLYMELNNVNDPFEGFEPMTVVRGYNSV